MLANGVSSVNNEKINVCNMTGSDKCFKEE